MGQFARLLPDFGWDVTVLTAKHDQAVALDHEAVEALAGRATIVESWSPLSAVVPRGHAVPRRGPKAAARRLVRTAALSVMFPDRQVLWVPSAIAAGRKALRRTPHDAVFATCGPASDLVIGRELARQFKLPLIVDFRDLWSTLPMPVFTTKLHRAAAHRLERSIVRAASRVVAVAPRMAEEIATMHGVGTERAVSITNGFDPSDVARVHDTRNGAARPFRLVYTGSVHANYNFDPFWRVIAALAREGKITPETFRIEFVGNLAVSDLSTYGVEAFVDTKPFVPHDRVFDEFAPADALLMIETAGYYARDSYAAKVFDYLITGKPVVALVEAGGYTWNLLEDAGVGYCADPADEAGIRRAVEQVLQLKGAPPRAVDSDAPPYRAFNRSHLARRLASVLDEVVATEPHGRW